MRPRSRSVGAWLRPVLMLGGLAVAVVAGGRFWLQGGRIISIDDSAIGAAKVAVATDVSGIVAHVAVKEGQKVKQGDVLLSLDDQPFRIALAAARADLAQTVLDVSAMKQDYQRMLGATKVAEANVASDQANYDRYSNLVRGGSVTRAEYDDSRFKLAADQQQLAMLRVQAQVQLARLAGNADIDPAQTPTYQRAQTRVAEAERQLNHTIIRAPFAGIVTQVDAVQPGMYLAASNPAFALVSSEFIWAEGNPKETELTHIKPGDPVDITVDTYPGRDWKGVVESISPASGAEFSVLPAQNTSGNWVKVVQRIPMRVRITPQQDGPDLRAGMSVTLNVDTGHVRTLNDLF
jgi:membrane fusion protein (multidrug efflux system)